MERGSLTENCINPTYLHINTYGYRLGKILKENGSGPKKYPVNQKVKTKREKVLYEKRKSGKTNFFE